MPGSALLTVLQYLGKAFDSAEKLVLCFLLQILFISPIQFPAKSRIILENPLTRDGIETVVYRELRTCPI